MGRIDKAREATIQALVRDLGVDFQKAERWCDAWVRFANRHRVPTNAYFWDSARGWIDAQLAMHEVAGPVEGPRSRSLAR